MTATRADKAHEVSGERARVAIRLHAAALHLLRRLRTEDATSGLSAPRLSALSVLVFGGPRGVGELADVEQVTAPTMSRLARALEEAGLVRREADPGDGRRVLLWATRAGERLLLEGRQRRVEELVEILDSLGEMEWRALGRAAEILEGVLREEGSRRGEAGTGSPEA
ncbi:MAG: MarR family transcriptional regulator [Candidatus Palauibacterales bacterium]|nr:MarR family transcriptional regulator [Candidatus Palauibacterales bacterium]MDP2530838.1 MarR family transcriptional regulator [Candidatus Palauibacterales bacterium]MDP2584504.1 MarR family transcriptional regulator [Candidatus Palauibacterales bacterium]